MIKVNDILIAKEKFMSQHSYFKSRRFIVNQFDGDTIKITNYEDSSQSFHGWFDPEKFFLFDDVNINKDIYEALERYEFQSFQGVTLEGKIIQLDLPVPFVRNK